MSVYAVRYWTLAVDFGPAVDIGLQFDIRLVIGIRLAVVIGISIGIRLAWVSVSDNWDIALA